MLWALLPLALLFVHLSGGLSIGSQGRVFTGADVFDVPDQLQYLAWVRDAGEHVLVSNQFDLVPDPRLFLHPLFWLSGLAWRAGVSLQLAYLAWRPIAVAILLIGFVAYVRRLVGPDPRLRAGVLVLALFFATPAWAVWGWSGLGSARMRFGVDVMGLEMFPGAYTSNGLVFGLMPLYLLGVEALLDPARRSPRRSVAWYAVATGLAGTLVAWLHPWQGLTLLLIVAGLVTWMRPWSEPRPWSRLRVLAFPILATVAPFIYYFALSHTHSAWQRVSQPNGYPHLGAWFFVGVIPPLLLILPGLRGRQLGVQERIVRLWPAAALAVYFLLDRSWFYHALAGLSLPLAILALPGLRRAGVPALALVLLVAAFTIPGSALYVKKLHDEAPQHFLPASEASALSALARSRTPGGVLARPPLGTAVPAFSGRSTWVGHPIWTPAYAARSARADALFAGRLAPPAAAALVRESGARFVVADCRASPRLPAALAGVMVSARRFGCATVYRVR